MRECNHEWSNSFSINGLGTLDSVLECETCGERKQEVDLTRPPHLKHVSTERYESLKQIFKQPF
jgi:hypothetical protein